MNKFEGGLVEIDATLVYYQSPGQVEWYWHFFEHPHWHVAVILHTINGDVLVDPRMPYLAVQIVHSPANELFPTALIQHVRRTIDLGDPPWASVTPGTCVTIAKAVLGIRQWFVLTPYQLYRYIGAQSWIR